jgi:hypothetical protein
LIAVLLLFLGKNSGISFEKVFGYASLLKLEKYGSFKIKACLKKRLKITLNSGGVIGKER